jgi:putative nucleotidyltransferase with HDIG domain
MSDMTHLKIPDRSGCLALLEKYQTPHHIILHSWKVWDVAKVMADALAAKDHPMDMALLEAACLLHDIAKYVCIRDGKGHHDERGGEILEQEGLPSVARIVAQHVILKDGEGDAIKEEHLVYYADKRVVHDRVVSLDERFQYLADTYATNEKAAQWLMMMKDSTSRLERRLFSLLDFQPEDLEALVGVSCGC